MSNYIDLEPQVSDYYGTSPGHERRAGICDALRYLDSHPEHVPGRSMTRSEYSDIVKDAVKTSGYDDDWERGFASGLTVGDVKVIPEPEPTNTEKLADDIREVDGGHNLGAGVLAERLASLGWTKAPGASES